MPVAGVVPDMTSDTTSFLTLQRIYIARAESDRELMRELLAETLSERGLDPSKVDSQDFNLFCKYATEVELTRIRSVEAELSAPDWFSDVSSEMWDPDSCVHWLLAMKAFEAVRSKGHSDLGDDFSKVEAELALLRIEANAMTSAFSAEQPL